MKLNVWLVLQMPQLQAVPAAPPPPFLAGKVDF